MNKTLARILRLEESNEKQLAPFQPPPPEIMERVLLTGDLASLTPDQRLSYYDSVCRALKLNPLTKPFEYINLNGKLVLYARKDCTDQLRRIYGISIRIVAREVADTVFYVTAHAEMPIVFKGVLSRREDEAIGAVALPVGADARSNAMMKAETKAKRRVTLSICGLGMFDESELEGQSFVENGNDAERRVKEATANRVQETPKHWEDYRVHFGNMKGKLLGELDPSQLGWLQKHWEPGSSAEDQALLKVLREMPSDGPDVTEENYSEIVCHVGKAGGNILGKKVSEIRLPLLQWLHDNYFENGERRWGNPPTRRDARLKQAVDFALKKIE